MKAILLAAGASRRLMPLTEKIPKCLIKIGNKSIIEYQLDAIEHAGIEEAVIIVGYLKKMIIDLIGSAYKNIHRITYIENPDYSKTNTIYSLFLAKKEFINEDFIYFNADVLFHRDIVRLLVDHTMDNVLAVDYKKCGEEEVKFATGPHNRIVKLSKTIPQDEAEGEFIGVAKFGSRITHSFIDALEYYSTRGERNLFFEKAVENIIDKDWFSPLDISYIPNIEIDFPEDLEKAKKEIYPAIIAYEKSACQQSE